LDFRFSILDSRCRAELKSGAEAGNEKQKRNETTLARQRPNPKSKIQNRKFKRA